MQDVTSNKISKDEARDRIMSLKDQNPITANMSGNQLQQMASFSNLAKLAMGAQPQLPQPSTAPSRDFNKQILDTLKNTWKL